MYTLLPRFNINYIQYAENICVPKLCPFPAPPFCHSYLNLSLISGPPGTEITPFPYGLPNGDGAGWGVWVVGYCGLWGVGGRVQRTQTSLYNSNSILLFAQIKHKPTFTLCFTQPFTYFHLKRLLFCVKIK